jgi:hypothetical protein
MSQNSILTAGKYLQEQLRKVDPKVIETVYPDYWGYNGNYHTVVPGLEFGTTEVVTVRRDFAGTAVNYNGGGVTDIPLATYGLDTDSYKTLAGIIAIQWSYQELLQQQAAENNGSSLFNIDVVTSYNESLQKAIKEWVHKKTVFGDPSIGFKGLLNNANVTTTVLTDNLYALSSSDLHVYMKNLIKNFKKTALLTATPSDLIVNVDLFDKLTNPITGNNTAIGGSSTPFELLTDSKKGGSLRSIAEVNELSDSFLEQYGVLSAGSNQDMFVLYESSEETLDKMTSDIILTPPEYADLHYKRFGMVKISEVRIKQPFKVHYYFYPKATS